MLKNVKNWMFTAPLFLGLLGLMGCGAEEPEALASVPVLNFVCDLAVASGCDATNEGHNVYFGLEENTATDCGYQFAFYQIEDGLSPFEYWSVTPATAFAGGLSGSISHWVNSQAMPVMQIPKQTYKVCAFIDFNDNGSLDAFEPLHSSMYSSGAIFLPLSNWSNY